MPVCLHNVPVFWPGIQGAEVGSWAEYLFENVIEIICRSGYLIRKQGKCFFSCPSFSVSYKDKRHMPFIK